MNSLDPWRVMQSSTSAPIMVVPAPYWGHPFYGQGIPQGWAGGFSPPWEQGLTRGTDVFVGQDAPSSAPLPLPVPTLVDQVAPVAAPTRNGFSARFALDAQQHLHAEVCVDGTCYCGVINLGPAIAAVMARLAQVHTELHAAGGMPATKVSGAGVLGTIDYAVGVAGEAMVVALLGQHAKTVSAGFLDDIGDAFKSAGSGLLHGVAATVKKFKGPITEAATAAATAYGGPAAGTAAAALVGPVVDTAANLGKDSPQKAAAEQQARVDPQTADALATAKQAAAETITAFHVTETANQAATGELVAQQQIHDVVQAAERGDPAAHAMVPFVQHGFSRAIAGRRPGSITVQRRRAIGVVRRMGQQIAARGGFPLAAFGYLHTGTQHQVFPFRTVLEARRWFASLAPRQYRYIALFSAGNLVAPWVENLGTV
jgi:hypothetical protein